MHSTSKLLFIAVGAFALGFGSKMLLWPPRAADAAGTASAERIPSVAPAIPALHSDPARELEVSQPSARIPIELAAQPVPADDEPEWTAALAVLHALDRERFGELTLAELRELDELDLSGLGLVREDLEALAGLGLEGLNLANTGLTDHELAAVAGFDGLERLDLKGALVSDGGLARLAGLSDLRQLSLGGTPVGDAGMVSVAELANLRQLNLDGTAVSDLGLALLRELPLDTVHLGQTAITDEGLNVLREFELSDVSLYRMPKITDEGLRALEGQSGLRKLLLRGTDISEHGLAHLRGLGSLEELNASLSVTDAGMVHVGELTSLRKLALYSNPRITDASAFEFARLRSLESLSLQFTGVGDATLHQLAALEHVRFLDLRGTGVTNEAVAAFRASHPRCRVLH